MKSKSIIREMFSGERGMYEQIPSSKEHKQAEQQMYDAIDEFLEKLDEEQVKSFDEPFMQMLNNSAEYAADHFVEGFKFGLLMGIECMDE